MEVLPAYEYPLVCSKGHPAQCLLQRPFRCVDVTSPLARAGTTFLHICFTCSSWTLVNDALQAFVASPTKSPGGVGLWDQVPGTSFEGLKTVNPSMGGQYFTAEDSRPIILFDGQCNLCNGGVQFMLDWDTQGIYRYAALQSGPGQELLQRSGRRAGVHAAPAVALLLQ